MKPEPQRPPPRYVVGIDLGTTNSAVAHVDSQAEHWRVQIFAVPQPVAPGEVEPRETLPSFHYEPAPGEFPGNPAFVVGVLARDHGASVPGRLIVSAKSWLCHAGVDRTADLLPWHGLPGVKKLSPAAVSARYLAHIREMWNQRFPKFPLEEQDVVVTIPASFDEIARELTVEAAKLAGLPRMTLVEEPQAAFYAWVQAHDDDWQKKLKSGQTILVCDVGGGTSDFTLIRVERGQLRRFAVGEHLILGGDNLDLALAHFVEQRLLGEGRFSPAQWGVLVRRCQAAKETLLGPNAPVTLTLSVPAAGAKLIGGAMQTELSREEVTKLLVDGFVPRVALDEKPVKRGSGFQEFGLPYAPDPAITRYLAAFLTAHDAKPDAVLLNGGFFESAALRERLLEVLNSWREPGECTTLEERSFRKCCKLPAGKRLVVLENRRLDLAVAVGAAYYGLVRRGAGVRIAGGLARTYYIGVATEEKPAAICLVPAGLEEGHEVKLAERKFTLLIRQPAEFPLYVSTARTTDKPGDLVAVDDCQLTALPPIRAVLKSGKKVAADAVSVNLHARLTEIGTLEIWCGEVTGSRTWRLQFDVRAAASGRGVSPVNANNLNVPLTGGTPVPLLDEASVGQCIGLIRQTFNGDLPPPRLVKTLEETLGLARQEWPPALLRSLWQELMELEEGRKRSFEHEIRWLNLLGFALRPGYGFALDDWRVTQTWRLAHGAVAHPRNEQCRAQWWILWRRVAGGLNAGQQLALAEPVLTAWRARAKLGAHETEEVWRFLGSLECLEPELKVELGELLLEQVMKRGLGLWSGAGLWALGRIGARVPLYGPLNTLVPAEVVERWLAALVTASGAESFFGFMQLGRRTGDRYRDLSSASRAALLSWMERHKAPAHLQELVRVGGEWRAEDQTLAFGESLPRGLRLIQ